MPVNAVTVRSASDTPAELATASALTSIIESYDLTPWTFTHEVVVDEAAIPHSHPVLTLNTRNGGDFLLTALIHEQLHWHCVDHWPAVERVIEDELRSWYPIVPVGRPDGARDEQSTYLHLIVCWLEVAAMESLVGLVRSEKVRIATMTGGLYRWVYSTVRSDTNRISACVRDSGLAIEP